MPSLNWRYARVNKGFTQGKCRGDTAIDWLIEDHVPTYYQHTELRALGSIAMYVLCLHGYHQFSLVGTVTVVDECGRTVVSYKTGVFVGLENVKCPATFRCRRMSGVTLKNCGRSTMQGDKLRWSFYRKIDSWFLWLLIEIPPIQTGFSLV